MNQFISYFYSRKNSTRNTQTLLLVLFFLFYLFYWLFDVYKRIGWCDGTLLADWLITYEDGGYKRRGLTGIITIFLSKTTGIYVGDLVFYIISLLYVSFSTMLILFFRKLKFNFSFILLFLLPTIILFPINDFYAYARKEFLFFMVLVFYLLMRRRYNVYSWRFIISFSILLIFLTHLHESIVFYISYMLIVYYIDYKMYNKGSLTKIIVLGSSVFLSAFSIFYFGVNVNMGGSWEIYKELGVNEHIMQGILTYPLEGFSSDKTNALSFATQKHYETHLVSYLITLVTFIFFLIKNKETYTDFKKIIFLHLIFIIISLPIFFLTIDWGRWLNIHFLCSFLVLTNYLPRNQGLVFSVKDITSKVLNLKFIYKLIILLVLTFGFTMRHVEDGFILGGNNCLNIIREFFTYNTIQKTRDLIWLIRNS